MAERPSPVSRQVTSADAHPYAPMGDLRSYIAVVRRRKWSVLLVMAITVAAASFFSYRQTPMFRSSVTVLVKSLNPSQGSQVWMYDPTIGMPTERQLALSPDVAAIASQFALDHGASSINNGSAQASVTTDTPILTVSYSSPSPTESAIWAQAYGDAYIEYRQQQAQTLYDNAQDRINQKVQELTDSINQLEKEADSASPSRRATIESEIRVARAQIASITRDSTNVSYPVTGLTAQLIAPAAVPDAPYAPNWPRNIAVALFAGLALGLAVAFLRERLDDRFLGREDLEESAGAPVLAIVPSVHNWKRNATKLVARDAPKTAPAEAYRTLRTNVGFMARTNELKMISMVSPSMGEGKTTTTANLAVALAHSGKRVVAVSCDLRKPRLHRFFGLTNDVGVTSVLRDGISVPEAAQRIQGIDTLRVIASGPVPHDPAELLGSEMMEELLSDLRRFADFVIVDTAPVLVVSDALSVAPKTDGVIIMADAGATMRGAVKATREQLELVGANIVGAVFNNFDPSRAKMYYGSYRYHYYSSYQYQDKPEPRARGRKGSNAADLWK